jgi:hypothetical protein
MFPPVNLNRLMVKSGGSVGNHEWYQGKPVISGNFQMADLIGTGSRGGIGFHKISFYILLFEITDDFPEIIRFKVCFISGFTGMNLDGYFLRENPGIIGYQFFQKFPADICCPAAVFSVNRNEIDF